jgi:maleylpyruvate isomerase
MARTRSDARRWMQQGAALVSRSLASLDDAAFIAPTDLPGWTRAHVVAHLSANAEAVGRLVRWAATGEPTPMYSSMDQRNADIEAGSRRSCAELAAWFAASAEALDSAMAGLTEEQWRSEVVTAQGRTVPASETPWMRAREVMVHAVDLSNVITFDDLPADFLAALCDDIVGRRSVAAGQPGAGPALVLVASDSDGRWAVDGDGDPVTVAGSLGALTSYLAGRGGEGLAAVGSVPTLPAWL